MKQPLYAVIVVAMLAVAPASAEQADEHSQHHTTTDGQTTAPAASTPDGSASSQAPNETLPSATPESGGTMQMMMRNMPGHCRAAMQGMPPACMSMMNKMMQGSMMQGGMMQGGMMQNGSNPAGNGTATGAQAGDHSAHDGAAVESSSSPASAAPHVTAFGEAIERMHEPMTEGVRADNPDVAFARGMIPHHQAAIDMALVVLQHGNDEQMRKLALDVIREQNREIAEMNEWLRLQSQ